MTNDFSYNVRSEVIGAAMGTNSYSYVFDPIGSRLAATNNADGWVYLTNPLNQYTNIMEGTAPSAPLHDPDGNMTATGDGWQYVWNAENRMVLASSDTTTVTYAYDHQGRMVAKAVDDVARQYLWDGYNIVRALTHSPTHTLTNSFLWGLDLSGSLQGAGGVGGLLAEVQDGVPYFAAFDANGNVTECLSTNGIIAARYEYSPFCEITVQSGDLADTFTHRFSTKPWCMATGLSEYEKRKYEPGMGRWRSRDPIREQVGLNLYGMVGNNPANKWDYLGLELWNNFIKIVSRKGRYKKQWYKYSGFPFALSASPYIYKALSPPETLKRKDNCGRLQAIEYEIEPAGGLDAFNKVGDPNDPYRLWDGGQIKADWGYRNEFRYFVDVVFAGSGIQTSTCRLWELITNWDEWTWRTIAPKMVVEPISTGAVSLTVTVRLHLLTDDRTHMQGVTDATDVYILTEDKYEIEE